MLQTLNFVRHYCYRLPKWPSKYRKPRPLPPITIAPERKNEPVQIENPFLKEKSLCLLCKYSITPNYKNVRLLSQFVSRFTGKIYGKHITGLCATQQRKVEIEIKKARKAALMPAYFREPRFAHDPVLYNPDNPFRPHRF